MKKLFLLIIFLSLISCNKKKTLLQKESATEFTVIDSKFPLILDKIDFENEENFVQLNDEINSKITKTVTDFYNLESGVDETYKKYFGIKDCYFKTIRLNDKSQTLFFIILKSYPSMELRAKVLFYDTTSKKFIGKPLDFKIYALYEFTNGKISPTNLKKEFNIETPEIKVTNKNGENLFEFKRLWHNGTFNAIETTILKVTETEIDTVSYGKRNI